MAFFSSTPPQRELLLLHPFCKCSSLLHHFKFHSSSHALTFSLPKHALQPGFSPLVVRAHVSHIDTKVASTYQEPSNNSMNHTTDRKSVSGFSHFRDKCKRVENKSVESNGSLLIGENNEKSPRKNGHSGGKLDFRQRRETGSGSSPMRSKDEILVRKVMDSIGRKVVNRKEVKQLKKGVNKELGKEKKEKGDKKSKVDSPGLMLRVGLDKCSKNGDVMGAIQLYDSAQREGIEMGQYHYTVLLYLCSSAATGVVLPAKSGSGSRSLSTVDSSREVSTLNSKGSNKFGETCNADFGNIKSYSHLSNNGKPMDLDSVDLSKKELEVEFPSGVGKPNRQVINGTVQLGGGDVDDLKSIKDGNNPQNYEIRVSEDFKKYALKRGFEIYEKMCLEKIPMNEASLTSIARMALAMDDGDMAFDMVKQMNELGINARLRSYGPALSAFCNAGNIEKAFLVEQHMLEHGVYPEEPELEALLRVSIDVARGDKVYYLLHKLRTSVRQVSPSTADLLEKWFKSNAASKVGNIKWDERSIKEAIEKGGGGWHGEGWLGKGKWTVSRTSVGDDGICKCCGEKLATIDLDPIETEKFAESVASIAAQREKKSSFQRFQKWLDYYGPFEAVVDGANVGLFTQRNFKPSKVNAVVNGIRHLLPSKKWPLIVLHNRRVTGDNMDKPVNKALVEKWKNADALYATPTGSNDDWYWLYAAIRFKCLMVTNDEMRDHLFQLLGNDFFPKWKERHQVRFSFSDTGPVFHMPPPCSVVIQESEKGYWHIPIVSGHDYQEERTWLCITRDKSPGGKLISAITPGEPRSSLHKKGSAGSGIQAKTQAKLPPLNHDNPDNISTVENLSQETYETLKNKFPRSVSLEYPTILWEIEAAEKLGGCIIDFEI